MAMDSFIAKDPTIFEKTPFKKGEQIITTLRVLDVFRTPEEAQKDVEKENITMFNKDPKIQAQKKQDEKVIEDYLKANNIKATKTTWGAYIQTITPGQGPKANPGQYALLRYTGMDLSGKVFDSNNTPGKPVLPLQVGAGGAIIGFEDAVRQLSKGEKARVYIPSVLGYGEMGSPPMIQPNQNLMFDIEVVDITSQPPVQQQPGQPVPNDTTRR
jgi:FKBP-type peptidyl-prolyl cis-trans isomerase